MRIVVMGVAGCGKANLDIARTLDRIVADVIDRLAWDGRARNGPR